MAASQTGRRCELSLPAAFFLVKEVARLSGRFHDDQDRLSLAFEVEGAATVLKVDVVGDVIVGAVIAAGRIAVRGHIPVTSMFARALPMIFSGN